MDVVIRLGVRIEMHWPLFSIGTLQLNSSQNNTNRYFVATEPSISLFHFYAHKHTPQKPSFKWINGQFIVSGIC